MQSECHYFQSIESKGEVYYVIHCHTMYTGMQEGPRNSHKMSLDMSLDWQRRAGHRLRGRAGHPVSLGAQAATTASDQSHKLSSRNVEGHVSNGKPGRVFSAQGLSCHFSLHILTHYLRPELSCSPTQIIITAAKSLISFWVPKGEMTLLQQPNAWQPTWGPANLLLATQLEV